MGDKTGIAWTETTWNPLRGCSKASPGCRSCYAEKVAARFCGEGMPFEGTITNGKWNGVIRLVPEKLLVPMRWQRPRRVFTNSVSDWCHPNVPFSYWCAILAVMGASPWHIHQPLTKHPHELRRRMERLDAEVLAMLPSRPEPFGDESEKMDERRAIYLAQCARFYGIGVPAHFELKERLREQPWPLPNVWQGTSCEDQPRWDERVPELLRVPATLHWVSVEPQIGPIDTRVGIEAAFCPSCGCDAVYSSHDLRWHCFVGCGWTGAELPPSPLLGWVVVGGESGRRARPFRIGWARDIVADCHAAGVACFVKQLGSSPVGNDGARYPGINHPKGEDTDEWPPDIRVQEYPR